MVKTLKGSGGITASTPVTGLHALGVLYVC